MSARVGVDYLIGFDADAFESDTVGSAIVKFADIQHTTIRQCVSVSNRQHTTAGCGANHARTALIL